LLKKKSGEENRAVKMREIREKFGGLRNFGQEKECVNIGVWFGKR
jgi:hypothetical protein